MPFITIFLLDLDYPVATLFKVYSSLQKSEWTKSVHVSLVAILSIFPQISMHLSFCHTLDVISIVFLFIFPVTSIWKVMLIWKRCDKYNITGCCVITECDAPRGDHNYIHGGNINDFAGCTIIKGIVKILDFFKWAVMVIVVHLL